MFIVDVKELKGILAKNEINKTKLTEIWKVSKTTVTAYFKNPSKIPYDKILTLANELHLTPDEARRVFFHQKLTSTQDEGGNQDE